MNAARVQRGEDVGRALPGQHEGGSGVVEHAGSVGDRGVADDDAQRLLHPRASLGVADCELRVVGENGAGADDDRAVLGTLRVDVDARGRAGDPLRRAIRRRAESIEGRGVLPAHERARVGDGERPVGVEVSARSREGVNLFDGDACLAQDLRSPGGRAVRVGLAEDNTGDAGADQSARTRRGAPGVRAGFEGDVRRRATQVDARRDRFVDGRGLGVPRARAAVVALREDDAVSVDDDAPDTRIGVDTRRQRSQLRGALHGTVTLESHEMPSGPIEQPITGARES